MKKLAIILLACILCMSFVACGEAKSTHNPTSTKPEFTQPTSTQPTEGNAPTKPQTCYDHVWVDATCTAPKTCANCGATEGAKSEHQYTETARVEATSNTDGSVTYTCSVCKGDYEEVLYATGSVGLEYKDHGNGNCAVVGIGTCTDRHVVIPAYYNGMKVVKIDQLALTDSSIERVTLPNTIMMVYANCFGELQYTEYGNCYYLGNAKNPYLVLVSAASTECSEYTIHEDTKVIAGLAFDACKSMTAITIPDNVISVGGSAFYDCPNLQYTEYGNCYYLGNAGNPYYVLVTTANNQESSYTIHQNTKIIASTAFNGCRNMASLVIPNGVTHIGDTAFIGSDNLESVVIPDSVISLGEAAFMASAVKSVVLGKGITLIERETFYGCGRLNSIVISDSVTAIGEAAFFLCRDLKSVEIPNSVTRIGKYAFGECYYLRNVTLGIGLKQIDDGAFGDCYDTVRVDYCGTMEQWQAISKGDYWVRKCVIQCTDGQITE